MSAREAPPFGGSGRDLYAEHIQVSVPITVGNETVLRQCRARLVGSGARTRTPLPMKVEVDDLAGRLVASDDIVRVQTGLREHQPKPVEQGGRSLRAAIAIAAVVGVVTLAAPT